MKNRKKKKRSLALLLSLSMVMSAFSGITVHAEDGDSGTEKTQFQFVSYEGLNEGQALPTEDVSVSSSDNQWVSAEKKNGSQDSYIAICDVTPDDNADDNAAENDNGGFKVVSDSGYTTEDFDLYLVESWCEENQSYEGKEITDEAYLSDVEGQKGVIKCSFPSTALGRYELRCTEDGLTDKTLTLEVNYNGDVELYETDVPTEDNHYDGDKIHAGGSTIYLAQLNTDIVEYSNPVVSVQPAETDDYTSDENTVAQYVEYNLDKSANSGSNDDKSTWESYAITIKEDCPKNFNLKVEYTAKEKDSEGTYTRSCSHYIRTKGDMGFYATQNAAASLRAENGAEQINHLIYQDGQEASFYYAVEGANTYKFQLEFEGDNEDDRKTEIVDLLGENGYFTADLVQQASEDNQNVNIYKLTLNKNKFKTDENGVPLNVSLNVVGEDLRFYISWDDGVNKFIYVEKNGDDYYKCGRDRSISPATENVKTQTITIADFNPDTGTLKQSYKKADIDVYKCIENWDNVNDAGEPQVTYEKCDDLKSHMSDSDESITFTGLTYENLGEYRIVKSGNTNAEDGLVLYINYEWNDVQFYGDEARTQEWGIGDYEHGVYGDYIYIGLEQAEYTEDLTFEITGTKIHSYADGDDWKYITDDKEIAKYVTFDKDKNAYRIESRKEPFGLCVTAKITRAEGTDEEGNTIPADSWTVESERDIWLTPTGIGFVYPDWGDDGHSFPENCDYIEDQFEMAEKESRRHMILVNKTADGTVEPITASADELTITGNTNLTVQKCENDIAGCYEFTATGSGEATLAYEGEMLTINVKKSMMAYGTGYANGSLTGAFTPAFDPKESIDRYDCWKNDVKTIYVKVTPNDGEKFVAENPIHVFTEGLSGATVTEVDPSNHIYEITLPGHSYDGCIIVEAHTQKSNDPEWTWDETRVLNVYAEGTRRTVYSDDKTGQGYCAVLQTEEEYLNTYEEETSFDKKPAPLVYLHAETIQDLIDQANGDKEVTFTGQSNATVKDLRKEYNLDYLHITFDASDKTIDNDVLQKEQLISSTGTLKGIILDMGPQMKQAKLNVPAGNYEQVYATSDTKVAEWLKSLGLDITGQQNVTVLQDYNNKTFDVYKVKEGGADADYKLVRGDKLNSEAFSDDLLSYDYEWMPDHALFDDLTAPKILINADGVTDYRMFGHLSDVRVLMGKDSESKVSIGEPTWTASGELVIIDKKTYTKADLGTDNEKTFTVSGLTYDNGTDLATLPAFPLKLFTQKVEVKASGSFVDDDKDAVSITEDTIPDISTVKDVELSDEQVKAIADSGASVKIDLVVDTIDSDKINDDPDTKKAIDAINSKVQGNNDYKVDDMTAIDINLETSVVDKDGNTVKFDENTDSVKIAEVDEPIEITIKYPGEMDSKYGYDIIRYHDGKAEIIKAIIDRVKKTLTFKSDKFSVYGIVPKTLKTIDEAEKTTLTESMDKVITASSADDNTKKTYDGKTKTFTIVETDLPEGMTVEYGGTCSATEPGTYTAEVTFKLNENYYDTSKLSTEERTSLEKTETIQWTITGKKTLNVNEVLTKVKWNYSQPFTADGKEKTVTLDISKLDAGFTVTYTGTQKATDAGTYTVTAKINYPEDKYTVSAAQESQLYLTLDWEIKASGGSSSDPSGGGSGGTGGGSSSGVSGGGGSSSGEQKPADTKDTEETWADGTKVETKTVTAADGSVTKTITATSADGKRVVKLETKLDAKGNETASKMEIIQTSAGKKNTFDLTAANKLLADTVSNTDITFTAKKSNGKTVYKVSASKSDLAAAAELYVYKVAEDGSLVMVDRKANTVKVGDTTLMTKLAGKGSYQLVKKKQATKIDRKILKTVKAAKTSAKLKKGGKVTFKLSKKLNKDNVKSITYTSSNKKIATVSKKGNIKAIKAGTVIIKATITLNNGTKKVVKMKVTVK